MISFSVIIVTHAREELLMKCLGSLSSFEKEWELVLVANGKKLSADILEYAASLTPFLKVINTDTELRPGKARNIAIKEITGPWVYFLDDDAFVPESYWSVLWPLLEDSKIDVLGGPDAPAEGMSSLSWALALALSSPFCTGSTFYRHRPYGTGLQYANEEKLTSCNLWVRTEALKDVEFPEDFVRGEENLFLIKLKALNRGMFYHPKLKVFHHRRNELKKLVRPTFCAGVYRSKIMRLNPSRNNGLFWLPAAFVLFHFLVFLDLHLFLYLARVYLGLIVFVSISICMRANKPNLFLSVAFFHYFVVLLYGAGLLFDRLKLTSAVRARFPEKFSE